MALRKSGTRQIVVGDATYRWTVAPNDEPGLGIVVELHAAPCRRLVTWVDHGTVIAPALVRATIEHGLAHGWQPTSRGPDLVFRR